MVNKMKKNDYIVEAKSPERIYVKMGLTKREYFTAAVLTGITTRVRIDGRANLPYETAIAIDAVRIADAVIKELENENRTD